MMVAVLLCGSISVGVGLKQQGDAPNAGQTNHRVDDAGKQSSGTTADPSNQIELEQSDATPVKGADDGDEQS